MTTTVLLTGGQVGRTAEPEREVREPVAVGTVGESGASSVMVHRIEGKSRRLMVLRNTGSNLCGNTGAVALLVVDCEPQVHGAVTKPGSSIQLVAGPGDSVVATVQTIPLFNGIECVRLGELHLALEARDP